MKAVFGKGKQSTTAKPNKLVQELERKLGAKRADWTPQLLRTLWSDLQPGITRRGRSLAHETNWLSLAGYLLRPGFGYPNDPERIEELWRLTELGLAHKNEARVQIQSWILWRRVSGGLEQSRQELLFTQTNKMLSRSGFDVAEAYRLLGSLTRVSLEPKTALAESLVRQFEKGKIEEATAWAFGRIASRIAINCSKDLLLPARQVEEWLVRLAELNWRSSRTKPLVQAIQLVARVSDHSDYTLSEEVRNLMVQRLREADVGEPELSALRTYQPLLPLDEASVFGESLPMGLRLLHGE